MLSIPSADEKCRELDPPPPPSPLLQPATASASAARTSHLIVEYRASAYSGRRHLSGHRSSRVARAEEESVPNGSHRHIPPDRSESFLEIRCAPETLHDVERAPVCECSSCDGYAVDDAHIVVDCTAIILVDEAD